MVAYTISLLLNLWRTLHRTRAGRAVKLTLHSCFFLLGITFGHMALFIRQQLTYYISIDYKHTWTGQSSGTILVSKVARSLETRKTTNNLFHQQEYSTLSLLSQVYPSMSVEFRQRARCESAFVSDNLLAYSHPSVRLTLPA